MKTPTKTALEKTEKVVIDQQDWIIIIDFLKSIPIPFTESERAAIVLNAIKRAQLGSLVKTEEKT